jgi:hypothetical protein
MKKDELLKVRSEIIKNTLPVVLGDMDDKYAQFEILLRVIQSGSASDADIFKKAYDIAQSLEDQNTRLDSLMRLLDEVDIALGTINERPPANSSDAADPIAQENSGE